MNNHDTKIWLRELGCIVILGFGLSATMGAPGFVLSVCIAASWFLSGMA